MFVARPGSVVWDLQAEWSRVTGQTNVFFYPAWHCAQMRALRSSMGRRFPISRHGQELALLALTRVKPSA